MYEDKLLNLIKKACIDSRFVKKIEILIKETLLFPGVIFCK